MATRLSRLFRLQSSSATSGRTSRTSSYSDNIWPVPATRAGWTSVRWAAATNCSLRLTAESEPRRSSSVASRTTTPSRPTATERSLTALPISRCIDLLQKSVCVGRILLPQAKEGGNVITQISPSLFLSYYSKMYERKKIVPSLLALEK